MAKEKTMTTEEWNAVVDKEDKAHDEYYTAIDNGDNKAAEKALREYTEATDALVRDLEKGGDKIGWYRKRYSQSSEGIYSGKYSDLSNQVDVRIKKAAGKQIGKYWENADYNQQKERKRWNEEGKKKAQAKLNEARNNWKYFNKRYDDVKKSTQSEFYGSYYNSKTGTYGPKVKMTKQQYLNHCAAETGRWAKEMNAQKKHIANYNNGIKESTAAMQRMEAETEAKNAKKTLPKDSKKAKSAERNVKNTKKVPQTVVNKANNPTMPKEVEDEMKKLGQDYKLITLNDSKGNNIYCFEKDGKHAVVMTQLKDQNPSKPMEVKSDAMNALVHEAVQEYGKKNPDFTEVISKINDQSIRDIINSAEIGGLRGLKAQLNTVTSPKIDGNVKITMKPTVQVVPRIKRNGEPSKKNFNIQLMDADGKVFILDKKTMEKAIKQQSNASATRGEMVDASWKNYLDAAKEGKLPPETVASFFKEAKPNIPQTQLTAVQMAQRKDASRNG